MYSSGSPRDDRLEQSQGLGLHRGSPYLARADFCQMAAKSTPMASSAAGVLMSSIHVAGFLTACPCSTPGPPSALPSPYSGGTPGMACAWCHQQFASRG